MTDKLIKKVLEKRKLRERKKIIEPIVGGVQERPGRSNPRVLQREPEDAIEISPSITAYKEGQTYNFIPPDPSNIADDVTINGQPVIKSIHSAGPVTAKKVDDLVIEGGPSDFPFPETAQAGKIIFNPEGLNPGDYFDNKDFKWKNALGEKIRHPNAPKLPDPQPATNLDARERLERQISDLMAEVNQGVRVYNNATKDALDLLEIARTTAYTEPLGEVSAALSEAKMKLSKYFPLESKRAYRLANLAVEIEKSEEPEKGEK